MLPPSPPPPLRRKLSLSVENWAIFEFLIVVESDRGLPLKVKKNDESRVSFGRICDFRVRKVRFGSRVRARVRIWSSGDETMSWCN